MEHCLRVGPSYASALRFLVSTLILCSILICPVSAFPEILFQDDFESYAPGTYPGTGGWIQVYDGAGSAQQYVDSSHANSGANSFRTAGSYCWASSHYHPISTASETISFEASVYIESLSNGCTRYLTHIGLYDPDTASFPARVLFSGDGNIYAEAAGAMSAPLRQFEVGTWYRLRMEYHIDTRRYEVFIDGEKLAGALAMLPTGSASSVLIGAAHGSNPIAWFDDILVTDDVSCLDPLPGAVSWWRGEGDAVDALERHDGATRNGVSYAPGKVGQSFSFDGIDDFVEVAHDPDFSASNAFSIAGWFYIDPAAAGNDGGHASLVSKTSGGVGDGEWFLWFQDAGGYRNALRFDIMTWGSGGWWPQAEPADAIPSAGWYHIVSVFDLNEPSQAKLYLNGELAESSTSTISTMLNNTYSLRIGASQWTDVYHAGNDRFEGRADEVEYFNRALTPSEIVALYGSGSVGQCDPDTAPDLPFFDDVSDAQLITEYEDCFTVTGINVESAVSIAGGEFSIGGGDYQTGVGTVLNRQQICVRQTSSDSYSTATNVGLTIGDVNDTFTVTTASAPTPTPTSTSTPTSTQTYTPTPTLTATPTSTSTATPSSTPTPTPSMPPTSTPTTAATATPVSTPTSTSVPEPTVTIAVIASPTSAQTDSPADLVAVRLKAASKAIRGKALSLTLTIENIGGIAAPAFSVVFYASKRALSTKAATLLGRINVERLAAGSRIVKQVRSIKIPKKLKPGTYYVIAHLKAVGPLIERSTSNNSASTAVKIR